MRKEYDFSKGRRNPYAARLKRQITIRLDEQTIGYFREVSQETGIPYQTLINLNSGDSIQQLTDDMRQRQNLQPWQGSPEWSFRISRIMRREMNS